MRIGRHEVGPGYRPLIVAELSANHNGSLERALEVVDAVAASGAQVLKLQTYTADTLTLDVDRPEFRIETPGSLWQGRTLYDLYREASTPWEWHEPIAERCAALGLEWFSSPFDPSAVDFLEALDAPAYKIASFEVVDLPLIRRAAATGKPLVISTGMAAIGEIDAAVRAARDGGAEDIVLLQCTSTYPATPENSNLRTIPELAKTFGCPVGLSDHTLGLGVPIAAVGLGAVLIEKHVTLARADGGPDSAFSLEPDELRALVEESERAWQALGRVHYGPLPEERGSLAHRRSLYITRDLRAGDVLSTENLRSVRPANGLPPRFLDELLGKRVGRDVARGTPASWDLLSAD